MCLEAPFSKSVNWPFRSLFIAEFFYPFWWVEREMRRGKRKYQSMPKPNIQKIYSSFVEVRDMNSIELNRFDIYFLFEISSPSMARLFKRWNKNSSDKKHSRCSAVRKCKITEPREKIVQESFSSKTNNFFYQSHFILFIRVYSTWLAFKLWA